MYVDKFQFFSTEWNQLEYSSFFQSILKKLTDVIIYFQSTLCYYDVRDALELDPDLVQAKELRESLFEKAIQLKVTSYWGDNLL